MAVDSALGGSIPPLVTPFRNGDVDYEAYARLVEFQISRGSHGVLVNGTTAEPSTLAVAERNRLVDVAMEVAGGTIPVVAATGSQSLAETRALTAHAVKAGVNALLVVTPYYIRPPQRGLVEYYLTLSATHETPWMIYHIPGRTAVSVTLDTLQEIRDRSSTFVGMKHAVNDLGFVSECLDALGTDFQGVRRAGGTVVPDDGRGRLRTDECGRQSPPRRLGQAVRSRLEQRSRHGAQSASTAVRSQPGSFLRLESDPDEIHDEAARLTDVQRTPPADGSRDPGTRAPAGRGAGTSRAVAWGQ
jgi:hypothetical protein